ncbi:MAG: hypothetical protein ABSG56_15535 [Bryobacteraceae bacterium]|jgi:hypothetical protein
MRALVISLLALPIGACAGAGPNQAIPFRDARKLIPAIAELVRTQEPFPHTAKARIELAGGGAIEVRIGGESRVLIPVRIRFEGLGNSYCRLAVVNPRNAHAEFVPLPVSADHDNCRGMQRMAAVDVNRDGIPDLVFQVEIPSNRYDVTVSEGAVYLSNPGHGTTYCYAPVASRAVGSDVPFDSNSVRAVVEAEAARHGKQVLDCYAPSSPRKPAQ